MPACSRAGVLSSLFRCFCGIEVNTVAIPEIIVAHHMDMKCFGTSIITDLGVPEKIVEISHEEIQKVAAAAEPNMTSINKELVGVV